MTEVRSAKADQRDRPDQVKVILDLELASKAQSGLEEVHLALFQAAQALFVLGQMAGKISDPEMEAVATLLSRGLRSIAEGEGECIADVSTCILKGLSVTHNHPDNLKP